MYVIANYYVKIIFIFSLPKHSLRKSSFHSIQQKRKQKSLLLKNGDYCIITHFEDFSSIYVTKAIKNSKDGSFDVCSLEVTKKTIESIGKNTIFIPVPIVNIVFEHETY